MSGWRVWFAYERRLMTTGPTSASDPRWIRGLREACRVDGKVDVDEFEHWMDVAIDYDHQRGQS